MSLPRRNFSKEQKLEIVNQSMEPGCDLEAIADSYKVHINTLYKWRREYLKYDKASFPGHGNKIMSAEKGAGRQVSVATVARRMQALKLVARPKRKFVSTTSSDHELSVAPNLLDRNFTVEELNTVWVSDITYIRTDDGWRYLTVVLDLADRSKVGIILKEFTPH